MSAEMLREAAALMRERAEAASGSPWSTDRYWWKFKSPAMADGWWASVENEHGQIACERDGADEAMADMVHIASWHPAVALAVADWLFSVAVDVDKRDNPKRVGGRFEALRIPDERAAVAVARAYLGRDA